ncbi:MAG: tRNA pseudouridine(38-40) synthase TruA [Firmicutes bacterium]|nr:tRNA pseudouridine(38-40) synthase TruA [Bacillota bacterium]
MQNFLLTLRFDGSAFCGWQAQPNGPTVQDTLEHAILRVTGEPVRVTGCSRTDAGVHAREYVCNFRSDTKVPAARLPAALNSYLPGQIAVLGCREAAPEFNARFDCKAKTYRYHIHNAPERDPFLLRRALLERHPLDEALLAREAAAFLGTHDFASLRAAGGSAKTSVRTVSRFDVQREGGEVHFYVRADGFLYHMARIMVGTLLEIARGRLPQGSIPEILAARDRSRAGPTAPAEGLMLWEVEY